MATPVVVGQAYRLSFTIKSYDKEGDFSDSQNSSTGNPLATIAYLNKNIRDDRVTGNAHLTWEVIEDLSFRISFGIDLLNRREWIFRYEYGINDNIMTIKAYDANGKYLDAKVESVYDDKGRLISRLMKKNSEILYKYQYDDKDNLIYEEEYSAYDTHPRIYDFHKYENTYDSKGHLISVFRYTGSYKRNMRLENRRDLIAMGEKAMKIERKDYTISGKVSYKYDANGNWIEQRTNFSGQEQVIYRLFQYRKNGLLENQYKGESQNLLNDDAQYKSATEPQHPEGKAGLFRFLAKHIKYPTLAQENNIKGRVDVRFVVNEDGKLSDFEVSKSVHPYLDNEALRVAKLLPRFIPALDKQGNPVRAYSTVSFTF